MPLRACQECAQRQQGNFVQHEAGVGRHGCQPVYCGLRILEISVAAPAAAALPQRRWWPARSRCMPVVMWFTYATAIPYGMLLPDASALRDTAETMALAERSGDDFALDTARTARAIMLVHRDGPEREAGFDLLTKTRETALNGRFSLTIPAIADIHIAREKARLGDFDGAIELARSVVDVPERAANRRGVPQGRHEHIPLHTVTVS